MKRFLLLLAKTLGVLVGAPLVVLALLALALALTPTAPVEARPGPAIGGLFHVHTTDSHDGYGTLEEAAAAAREAGARFLFLTEHNKVRPPRPTVVDEVLVIPGVEVSAKAGHVIALGLDEAPKKAERGADVLQFIAEQGGEAVLAHPVNLRNRWKDDSPDGFMGFETLSLDSAFRTAKAEAPWRLALALAALVGDPPKTGGLLLERPDGAFARYDQLSARRDVALLCGVDAHGLPPYAASFGALRLFLPADPGWGSDPARDAAAARAAIRAGRTFCSVPALGDASSFSFDLVEQGAGLQPAKAGAGAAAEAVVRVDAEQVTLVLYRDGREVARGPGPELRLPAGPGVWRAEVLADDPGFPFGDGALWIASSALRLP